MEPIFVRSKRIFAMSVHYDGSALQNSRTFQISGFLLMSAFFILVQTGYFLLINWAKRKLLKEKALLYSNEYESSSESKSKSMSEFS